MMHHVGIWLLHSDPELGQSVSGWLLALFSLGLRCNFGRMIALFSNRHFPSLLSFFSFFLFPDQDYFTKACVCCENGTQLAKNRAWTLFCVGVPPSATRTHMSTSFQLPRPSQGSGALREGREPCAHTYMYRVFPRGEKYLARPPWLSG